MKKLRLALLILCLLAYAGGCALRTDQSVRRGETGQAAQTSALRQTGRIPLPRVEGRIDHMALDQKGGRLFVAALGNNTVEVVDTKSGRRIDEIEGLEEPQGVAYLPDAGRLLVTNGGGDSLKIYDGRSLRPVDEVRLGTDPDNVRYDPSTGLAYVGYGGGGNGAAIGVVDVEKGEKVADVGLSGHPESFQLEGKGGKRVFANVPGSGGIEVADREKGDVVDTWPVREAGDNYPMALDEADRRLFVVTRSPARLLVLDTATGKTVASLDAPGDADDVFYDAKAKRIYVSGGDGTIGVFEQKDPDTYERVGEVPTAEGARTSLFVSETGTFYLAVPRGGQGEEAEVRVYETQPGK